MNVVTTLRSQEVIQDKLKILFVTQDMNWPLSSGGEIRQYQSLQAIKQCGMVDVVAFRNCTQEKVGKAFEGCNHVFSIDSSFLNRSPAHERWYRSTLGRLLFSFWHPVPFHFLSSLGPKHVQWFRKLVENGKYDVIWFVKARTALALHWIDRRRTVLDGDDIDSIREYHNLRSTPWYGGKIANYIDILKLRIWEYTFPLRFARVARCSNKDRNRLPLKNVIVIPNGTDITPDRREKSERREQRILFIASLSYAPNAIGLKWFISEIWGTIREQCPDAKLDIVGKGASDWLRSMHGKNGIYVHGFIGDVASIYDSAAISIAPLLAGGGTRLKILESLANKTAVVSTPIGAYGLNLGPEQGVIQERSANLFAEACLKLIADPDYASRIARNGFEAVLQGYDWKSIQQQIIQTVEQVSGIRERVT